MMILMKMFDIFWVQIKEKLDQVVAKQHELSVKWDKHWEALQQRRCTYIAQVQYITQSLLNIYVLSYK